MTSSFNYDSPLAIRRFLEERHMGMQKKFGQNFLINADARQRLADALDATSGEAVWEVGPGLGAMTALLLEKKLCVTAFELDRGFCQALEEFFGSLEHFKLVKGDVLKTWPEEAQKTGTPFSPPVYFFGNLPYNIAATVIAAFIENGVFFKRAVVTVQKEVAKRMTAKVGEKDYSSFSVLCASAYTVRPLLTLKPGSFYPAPNVDSQAVVMERQPLTVSPQAQAVLQPLVRALFASRRKMVKNNLEVFLASRGAPAGPDAAFLLAEARIDGQCRAEQLHLDDFSRLAQAISTSSPIIT